MDEQKAPQIIVPVNAPPMSPDDAAKGERSVMMVFDNPVHLTVENNKSIFFPKGVHPVPARHADHWYLKAHGVRPVPTQVAMPGQRQQGNGGNRNGGNRNGGK